LDTLNAGGNAYAKWIVSCNNTCNGRTAIITATGIVSGSVPATYRTENFQYPPYSYEDRIGGTISFVIN
jgi:hypothetical protein